MKENDVKNHVCYYFSGIININDLDLDSILLDEKSYENLSINDVAYKTLYGAKPLRIIFDMVDGYIRKYDKTKYLSLFHSGEKYEIICVRIRYLIMLKSIIPEVYSHKYTKIKINSDDDLLLKKTINIYNVVTLIKSVFIKNYSHYYYQILLEKYSFK